MSRTQIEVNDELAAYVKRITMRDADVFRRLREETAAMERGGMQISPEQGQFMQLLIELTGTKKALEVGVFTGYSSLSVAMALPPEGTIVACDVSEEWTSIARRYWKEAGVEHKIDLRIGPAVATLDKIIEEGQSGAFDFAFIDADKENYDAYYERALVLLRTGGLIGLDNMLWHGKVIDPSINDEETEAIRNLNLKIHADRRVTMSLLPIGDGLLLARKR